MLHPVKAFRNMSGRNMSGRSMSGRNMSGRNMSGRNMSGRNISGRNAKIFCMAKKFDWKVVSECKKNMDTILILGRKFACISYPYLFQCASSKGVDVYLISKYFFKLFG